MFGLIYWWDKIQKKRYRSPNKISEDELLEKDLQQKPTWIVIVIITTSLTVFLILSDLVIDFSSTYKKWIQLSLIITGFIVYGAYLFWKSKQIKQKIDKMSMTEMVNYYEKKAKWFTWQQNIFKNYPLNIMTFKFFPLFICSVISLFINKKYKSYLFDSFYFPRYWEESSEEKEKYNYKKVTSEFFESMFRVYIENLNQSYEIKFARDFQNIEIRWNNKSGEKFNNTKKGLYDKIFSEEKFKYIKIFTWIFPFGLCWNLIRLFKNLF